MLYLDTKRLIGREIEYRLRSRRGFHSKKIGRTYLKEGWGRGGVGSLEVKEEAERGGEKRIRGEEENGGKKEGEKERKRT